MRPGLGFMETYGEDATNSPWNVLTDWRSWALAIVAGYLLYRMMRGASKARASRRTRRFGAERKSLQRRQAREMAELEERYE